ncbi:molecular chaperone GrpE [Metamycoplasma subdolum]|uniref:Protein GrpE n=1 Tax=Metamycoplasma subdolum TaxID=92407 RepID=A0A3M0A1M8_9BACT|nr:nucleotide exchange factor GrpE [Metamycoplasma subdolum]RMA79091.1 molecular chaperone GrpE [Metamycoplasma subdolum]WPB50614.1 nucleotide exchange factor GrpE [Metamycoplasma subdolum]
MKIEKFDIVTLSYSTLKSKKVEEEKNKVEILINENYEDKELIHFLLSLEKIELNKDLTFEVNKKKNVLKIISVEKPNKKLKDLLTISQSLEEENQKLEEKISSLISKNLVLELENKKLVHEFKEKIKEFEVKAQQKLNDLKEKNNKHFEEQKSDAKKYALQSFLEDLIVPLSKVDQAFDYLKKSNDSVIKNYLTGFIMLYQQIEDVLLEHGVVKIIPEVGSTFNPEEQHAFELREEKGKTKDKILEVKMIGYKLNGRVLKPASVVVSK